MRLLIPFALFSGAALAFDSLKQCCTIWSFYQNRCLMLGYPNSAYCFSQHRPPPGVDPKCDIWNIIREHCEEYKDGMEDGFNTPSWVVPTSVETVTVMKHEQVAPTSVVTVTLMESEQPAPTTLYTIVGSTDS